MIRWVVVLVAVFAPVEPSFAQNEGGARADLTLGFGAIWDRDPGLSGTSGSGAHGIGSVQLGLSSKTRTQKAELQFDGDRLGQFGTRSDIRLSYARKTKASQLSFDFLGQQLPVGVPYVASRSLGAFDGFDLAPSQSRSRVYGGTVGFKGGIGRPVGVDMSFGLKRRETYGISDTRSTRQRAKVGVNLRVSSRTEGRVFWEKERLKTSGLTSISQYQSLKGVGLTHKPSAVVDLDFDLGWNDLTTENSSSGSQQNGLEWRASATNIRRSGLMFARASSQRTHRGSLMRLQFGLERSSPRQSLDLTIGVARLAGRTPDPTLSINYTSDLKAARVRAAASRDFTGSDETGETRMTTKFDLGIMREMSDRGTLDVSLGYFKTDGTPATPARSQGRLRASYHHAFRRDWNLVAGAQRRVQRDVITGRAGSNSLFLTFERKFSGGL